MTQHTERSLLQAAVAIACLVPLLAGGAGAIEGPAMIGGTAGATADMHSHFRYLSGLLLGLGIAFAASVATIERRGELFAILTLLVVVGGLARLASLLIDGAPGTAHSLALVMELGIVPILFLWQRRIARLFAG